MAWFKKASDVTVGVVGYGGAFNMGKAHLTQMQQAGMTPVAVCELDPKRLEVAKTDFPGIETYSTLEEMLKKSKVNLIVHITPHHLHFPLALKCLQAGRHVVTEKPFVLTTAQCDKLIAVAKKKNLLVSTYHNRHWDGWIMRAVDEIVQKKTIGQVFRIEAHMGSYGMPNDWWRTSKKMSGGALYDWGVHLLEYCFQLLPDDKVTEVAGFAVNGFWAKQLPKESKYRNDCIEDDAVAIVRLASGAMINLNWSQLRSFDRPGMLEIIGTQGTYVIEWNQWTLRRPMLRKDSNGKPVMSVETGAHWDNKGELFYQNVAEHLTGKAKLIITPQWARRPIHVLDLADQSARTGKTLKAKEV